MNFSDVLFSGLAVIQIQHEGGASSINDIVRVICFGFVVLLIVVSWFLDKKFGTPDESKWEGHVSSGDIESEER